jgi:hypothetical protein
MTIFSRIKGVHVEIAGVVGVGIAAVVFDALKSVSPAILALLALYILLHFNWFANLFNFLRGFAKVPQWPQFITWSLMLLLVARRGGFSAVIAAAFLLAIAVGRLFDELY